MTGPEGFPSVPAASPGQNSKRRFRFSAAHLPARPTAHIIAWHYMMMRCASREDWSSTGDDREGQRVTKLPRPCLGVVLPPSRSRVLITHRALFLTYTVATLRWAKAVSPLLIVTTPSSQPRPRLQSPYDCRSIATCSGRCREYVQIYMAARLW